MSRQRSGQNQIPNTSSHWQRFLLTMAIAGGISLIAFSLHTHAAARRNVILILSDDHRYDFMSFLPQAPSFLETPNLDRMAREGAYLQNAFVTTSLCSPSRASILTGQYMHRHHVVDNQRPVPPGTHFFPQDLQKAGYTTAFIGKWHMGHEKDDPRPGFDYWASFRGQGVYFDPILNINGTRKQFRGYTTDILTDLAIQWLDKGRDKSRPFFLYLSHKSVHYPFTPAPRNLGRYHGKPIRYPETMANTERNYQTQPHWVRERRFSIHGIDHMQTGPFDNDPVPDLEFLYWRSSENVYGLDENIGRLLNYLDRTGLSRNTVVIYLSDNGFELGEHGFYDKRDAFEQSIRVPMLVYAPGLVRPGLRISQMILNIDIAPTILDICGVKPKPGSMDGQSFLPLLLGKKIPWRDHFIYEYYWEWNFPATPTMFAIRTERYKYVYYYGIWDWDSFYDLKTDPLERHNLINVPAYQDLIQKLKNQLFQELEASGGLTITIRPPKGQRLDQRKLH